MLNTNYKFTAYLSKPWLKFLIVLVTLLVSGCSSIDEQQIESTTQNQPVAEIEIETSQGTQSITPTVVSYEPTEFEDSLEFINRPIFEFNDGLYRYFLIPVSEGYIKYVPGPVKTGIGNFFSNLREPLNMVNHIAQGEGGKFGVCLARFVINSTLGLFGLFDPADAWFDIKEQRATIAQTLRHYGVGYGNYLVLPILGQSDYRNAFSTIGESLLNPVHWISNNPETLYLQSLDSVNQFAPTAPSYEELYEQAEDPYLFFRNLYLQGVERDQDFPDGAQQIAPTTQTERSVKPTDEISNEK